VVPDKLASSWSPSFYPKYAADFLAFDLFIDLILPATFDLTPE